MSMYLLEENYRLLAMLCPCLRLGDTALAPGEHGALTLAPVEHSRYTTTLALRQRLIQDEPLLPDVQMTVRAYHDARVAEVIGYQGCERLPAPFEVYDRRFVRDERRQVNRLLHQILVYRLFRRLAVCQSASDPA